MNLAMTYATPAARLPTRALCNAPFSLGTPVKRPFTKPHTARASDVMAADTPNARPQSCLSMQGASDTSPPTTCDVPSPPSVAKSLRGRAWTDRRDGGASHRAFAQAAGAAHTKEFVKLSDRLG